jgi:putative membrane protein (TIGR04086 family)
MNASAPQPAKRPQLAAIGAGILSFVALYVLLGLLILFALALFSERLPSAVLYGSFKIVGLASWAVPGYVAARIAGQRGWLHGALTGVAVGLLVTLSMTFTFSWEGTVHDAVRDSMLKMFVIAWALCTLGGGLADILAARSRRVRGAK